MSDRGNALLRFFDRYLGIPAVFLAGLTVHKKLPPKPEDIDSVGILAIAAIGDTVLISAVLKDLLASFPGRQLTVFCSKGNLSAMKLCMGDTVLLVPIPVKNIIKAMKIIRQKQFDIFIDFGPWPRFNSLCTYASRSRCTIGFRSNGQFRHFIYNVPVEHRRDCHEIDNHRRLLAPLDIESRSIPFLGQSEPKREAPYIVVHMFPSGFKSHYKEWSDGHWIRLIDGLNGEGRKVILTGGPADETACRRIADKCRYDEIIDVKAGNTNLFQLGELLRRACAVITVNTGVMHMAAAYGQHVFALHGPTSVLRWGPLCVHAQNYTASSRSAGCLYLGFEYDRRDPHSLDTIDPKIVIDGVLKVLQ